MFQAGNASPATAVLAAPRLGAKQGVHETGVPNPLLQIVDSSSSTVRGRRGESILEPFGRHGPEGDSAVLHEEKRAERAHTRANTSSRPALRCAHITKITRNRNAAGCSQLHLWPECHQPRAFRRLPKPRSGYLRQRSSLPAEFWFAGAEVQPGLPTHQPQPGRDRTRGRVRHRRLPHPALGGRCGDARPESAHEVALRPPATPPRR